MSLALGQEREQLRTTIVWADITQWLLMVLRVNSLSSCLLHTHTLDARHIVDLFLLLVQCDQIRRNLTALANLEVFGHFLGFIQYLVKFWMQFLRYWANFHCYKWPNIVAIWLHWLLLTPKRTFSISPPTNSHSSTIHVPSHMLSSSLTHSLMVLLWLPLDELV